MIHQINAAHNMADLLHIVLAESGQGYTLSKILHSCVITVFEVSPETINTEAQNINRYISNKYKNPKLANFYEEAKGAQDPETQVLAEKQIAMKITKSLY